MLASSVPAKFPIPFANSAGPDYIRTIPLASQIGINGGWASLTDGFPPLNFTPIAAGGIPPFGQDVNGILHQTTAWSQWQQAGAPVYYDAVFSAQIGGYPRGAMLSSAVTFGNFWMSTVDNNLSNPDTGGANWITPPGMMSPGTPQWRPDGAIPPGFLPGNGQTLGTTASAATYADASFIFLYAYFWNGFSDARCPVSGGRGANAFADFAAGKPIQMLDMQCTAVAGVDQISGAPPTNRFTGVPIVYGAYTTPGSVIGENVHNLVGPELPIVIPTFTGNAVTPIFSGATSGVSGGTNLGQIPFNVSQKAADGSNFPVLQGSIQPGAMPINGVCLPGGTISTITPSGAVSGFGGNVAHNTTQRTMLGEWWFKL